MLAQYAETETPASRVIYINSKDATTTFNNNQSDFDFQFLGQIIEFHYIYYIDIKQSESTD